MPEHEDLGLDETAAGTAADYMRFLDWAEDRGELPKTTVQNWRNASIKVLEIEDNWLNLNVAEFDLDAHLSRFVVLRRREYTSGSMDAYRSRTKVGIEAYRRWLAQVPDWKPKSVGGRAPRNGAKKPSSAPAPGTVTVVEPKWETTGFVPHHPALIEYQLALRPGVRALLTLPEMLTKNEAVRIIRFVRGLAIIDRDDEETEDQLMITSGEESAE